MKNSQENRYLTDQDIERVYQNCLKEITTGEVESI
jgi:hypothetical protein